MKLVVNPQALTQADVEAARLQKPDRPGPSYTSYPTAFEARGLVRVNTQEIQVTDKGWFCIRAIAMVFDRYLPPADARSHFLRVV